MRPSDRAIRDELRREAAQAPIPGDMWENINRRLDAEQVRAERRRKLAQRAAQWRPALAFAAAAGIFWLTVVPANPTVEQRVTTSETAPAPPVVQSSKDLSIRRQMEARRDLERAQKEDMGPPEKLPLVQHHGITSR